MAEIPGWEQAPGTPHPNDPTRTWLDTDPDMVGVAPTLTSITPAEGTAGDAPLTLTATGSAFTPDAKVTFNGGEESTTYVSPTALTIGVDLSGAAFAVTPGDYPVTVKQKGGESEAQTFTINPAPEP